MAENAVTRSECRVGGWSGIAAILCYFGAAVLPLPDVVGRLLGLVFSRKPGIRNISLNRAAF